MLDVMSGGRMEYAFPLGTGMEYWANEGTINPTTARARFRESLDIILKSWTEDGPIRYDGEFYNYRYLNPWPKPFQKPRPKCFIVGTGSEETVSLAIDYDLGYSIVFVPIPNQLRAFGRLRELAEEKGRTIVPDDLIIVVMAYVAETDEQAVREARPHIEKFFSWFHRVHPAVPRSARLRLDQGVPAPRLGRRAGDGTRGDVGRHGQHRPHRLRLARDRGRHDRQVVRGGRRAAACNVVFENGDMPEWKTVKNMTMFAEEVMPRIQAKLARNRAANEAASREPRRGGELRWPPPRRSATTINGIDTAVQTAGEGEPLVFLHGAGTAPASTALLPLAERCAPDRAASIPGFGAVGRRPQHRRRPRLPPALPRPVRPASASTSSRWPGHSLGGCLAARSWRSSSRSGCAGWCLRRRSGCGSREHPTVDFFSIPDEESCRCSPPTCRSSPASRCRPRRSSWPSAIASRRRSRGSRGSGRTTRSCSGGCTG